MNIYLIPAWYPQSADDVTACFFREQAHALAERGHQVTVIHITPISYTNALRTRWHQVRSWQDGNVRTFFHQVVIPIPGKLTGLQDWYISRCFKNIIKTQINVDKKQGLNGPDLIHAHVSHSCAYYCLKTSRSLQLPLVVTEHYSGLLLGTASVADYERVRKTILGANAFIFVGSNFQKTICNRLGIDKKTYVIPNIVSLMPQLPDLQKQERPFTFLTACHLKKNKNVASVIRALHEAFPNDADKRLVVAGDGEMLEELKRLTKELHEERRVHFYGKYSREELPEVFGQANAFVLVSQVETFGIVYLEAMMCGLPCIGTAGQGAEDIITESNGLKVPYGDLDALKQAMKSIAEHGDTYDRMKIREECLVRFSGKSVAEHLGELYESSVN